MARPAAEFPLVDCWWNERIVMWSMRRPATPLAAIARGRTSPACHSNGSVSAVRQTAWQQSP